MKEYEKEINQIINNIGKVIYVNLPTSVKCTVIGYGVIEKTFGEYKTNTLNVLVKKHTPSHYKFPWKTELVKYTIFGDDDMNPDDFLPVPFYCIKTDKNGIFTSCY